MKNQEHHRRNVNKNNVEYLQHVRRPPTFVNMSGGRLTCYKYSITCQNDLLTVDNAQSHVMAFRPISEAARSWSDDNEGCRAVVQ